MQTKLSVLWLTTLLLALPAGADTYEVDPHKSAITFKIGHMLSQAQGRFNGMSGTVNYDPERPQDASVQFTVQTRSIDTENASRDEHLRSAEYFGVEKYPVATFASRSARKLDGNNLEVSGDFTLHGVTKAVTLTVTISSLQEGRLAASTEFVLNRLTYGVGASSSFLGDDVTLRVQLEAR